MIPAHVIALVDDMEETAVCLGRTEEHDMASTAEVNAMRDELAASKRNLLNAIEALITREPDFT